MIIVIVIVIIIDHRNHVGQFAPRLVIIIGQKDENQNHIDQFVQPWHVIIIDHKYKNDIDQFARQGWSGVFPGADIGWVAAAARASASIVN